MVVLVALNPGGAVLLAHQAQDGLWGGLWSLPAFTSEPEALAWSAGLAAPVLCDPVRLGPYEHSFTHFDLTLRPIVVRIAEHVAAPRGHRWYAGHERIGLSKPAVDLVQAASQAPWRSVP
jgi:A/G-specific adenine glycosylase